MPHMPPTTHAIHYTSHITHADMPHNTHADMPHFTHFTHHTCHAWVAAAILRCSERAPLQPGATPLSLLVMLRQALDRATFPTPFPTPLLHPTLTLTLAGPEPNPRPRPCTETCTV